MNLASLAVPRRFLDARCWRGTFDFSRNKAVPVFRSPLLQGTCALLALLAPGADALASHVLSLHYGPYVHHWQADPRHNNRPHLIGLEAETPERWMGGAMWFSNSFHQPSQYIYMGRRWSFDDRVPGLYAKLTAGPLLGYRGEYEDKIPVNRKGVGAGVIPALGYQYRQVSTQFAILGTAGYMITLGSDLLSW